MFGIIVCGIRRIRIWFGPLPFELCYLQLWATHVIIWYGTLIIFLIYLTKYMFVCVWKRIPHMNDNLMLRFANTWAMFISIWVPSTGFLNRKGNMGEQLCTGNFSEHTHNMNWQDLISPKVFVIKISIE